MKKKPSFKLLNTGTYPYDILFTIGTTTEEIQNYIKKNFKYDLDNDEVERITMTGVGRAAQLKNKAFVLWVKTDDVPVIAHEVFHIVEMLMITIECPLNDSTSEPYAYLTEYIWRQIIGCIKK